MKPYDISARFNRRQALATTLALGASLALGTPATARASAAGAWPRKPVKVLVGFPAGSTPDLTARLLADALEQKLGVPFVVDNRAGASGNIAARALAQASDEHTIGLLINGNLTIAQLINPGVGYDPLTDLAPVALVGAAPLVLATTNELRGEGDVRGFLQRLRESGARWNYGSPGIGTNSHLGVELLTAKLGIAPVHVPYPSNPQVLQALISGDIQFGLLPPALALAQQKAGKLAAIGITSAQPSALAPGLAPLRTLGIDGIDLENWNAIAAPASLPTSHVQTLSGALTGILQRGDIQEKLLQQGWTVGDTSAASLRLRIAGDTEALGAIIRSRGIRNQ